MRLFQTIASRHVGPGRRMWRAAYAVVAVAVAAVPVAAGSSERAQVLVPPSGLTSFELSPGDATGPTPSFTRTPSFAWRPVRGAVRYQFELSTSKSFRAGNGVVWSSTSLRSPVAAVPISLPWMQGTPLYWRVRAFGGNSSSGWSRSEVFRVKTTGAPRRIGGGPGYVKWSPVPGASGYEVSFLNRGKVVSTVTTVADLRDYYGAKAPAKAVWRVRAVRRLYGSDDRALPVVSFSPWSKTYTTPVAVRASGGLKTLSDGRAASASGVEHKLLPVFLFPTDDRTSLRHLYVTSDKSCKNVVFNSAIVHGSAFTPRSSQTVASSRAQAPVNDAPVLTKGGKPIAPTEAGKRPADGWARVDLSTGRYFWTVVPVERQADHKYHDLVDPATACRTHKGIVVRGANKPGVAGGGGPFVTGLSPLGGLFSADSAPGRFYGPPLVVWRPVTGATQYEVQWSRSENPWHTVGATKTFATSATLPLRPGTWWYRVRGLNGTAQGEPRMSWSKPVTLSIAAPTFAIVES